MAGSIGKALRELFLGSPKTGKPGKGKAKPKARPPATDARARALQQVRETQDRVMTPERAELLRNAMEVRKAKQQILADLNDEQRQKLVAVALRALLNEGREPKK